MVEASTLAKSYSNSVLIATVFGTSTYEKATIEKSHDPDPDILPILEP
jgi:hypothetical protein